MHSTAYASAVDVPPKGTHKSRCRAGEDHGTDTGSDQVGFRLSVESPKLTSTRAAALRSKSGR